MKMRAFGIVFEMYRLPKLPTTRGFIKGENIKNRTPFKKARVELADRRYRLASVGDMMELVKLNKFKEFKYIPEDRDCDDYQFALLGMLRKIMPGFCNGFMWVDVLDVNGEIDYKHAVNFFIDYRLNAYVIEPQTNMIFSLPSRWVPYLVVV